MKIKCSTITVLFVLCFVTAYSTYACDPPYAVLDAVPPQVFLGDSVVLDGTGSYYLTSPITLYEWDWDYNAPFTPDYNEIPEVGDKQPQHTYNTPGTHTAALRVTNSQGTDIATCTIEVITRVNNLTQNKSYGYIQPAIDEADNFDVIEVNESVYSENIDFKGRKVTLRSTDPNNWEIVDSTVICANEPDKAVVIFKQSEDVNAVIAGFKITGGLHGIECNNTRPVITNCIITQNGSESCNGGGIYNCITARPFITNCFIVENDANNGAGIYNYNSDANIQNCVISRNFAYKNGGGIYNKNYWYYHYSDISNCTITDNNASNGGGMYTDYAAYTRVINCIFWNNTATANGDEIYNNGDRSSFWNCDIKGCGGDNWNSAFGSSQGGNIDKEPIFIEDAVLLDDVNLVSYWRFDESGDNIAEDSIGINDGNVISATWIGGKVNNALDFDGVDDFVQVSDNNNLNITSDITISAWVYFRKGNSEQAIVTKTVNNGVFDNPYDFRTTDNSVPQLMLVRADTSGHEYVTSLEPIPLNEWHHVTVTVKNNNVEFYVDGRITEKVGQLTKPSSGNLNPMYIGRRADGLHFKGMIDEVMIFSKALSAQEVQQLCRCSAVDKYKYRIDFNSPCLNTGKVGNYNEQSDIHNHWRRQGGRVDIGAYEVEYLFTFPYGTSFEHSQSYNNESGSIEYETAWNIRRGGAVIRDTNYCASDANYSYQYTLVDENSVISGCFSNEVNSNSYVRINCIPSKDSYINLLNGSDIVASIHFEDNNTISVLDGGTYVNTSTDYGYIADKCRSFLNNKNWQMQGYSYENTWVEIKLHFDWVNQRYDVFWSNWDNTPNSPIKTGAAFNGTYNTYTQIQFITGNSDVNHFCLNRISTTDEPNTGGVFGDGNDVWITSPVADYENPIKGRCDIIGDVWYDKLAEYKIECCQMELDASDANNWFLVDSGDQLGRNRRLGYWNAALFINGDYYLRIRIYDDLGRQYCGGWITKKVIYNNQIHDTNSVYSIIGRYKGQLLAFQESPDIKVNWPGSFPFEFTRIYNHGLRNQIYPLFFGWTHNHNIKLVENCTSNWATGLAGAPAADNQWLCYGRLWLMLPTGGMAFKGQLDVNDPDRVIYKTLDGESDYVIRTSTVHSGSQTFDVNYTYYAPDGMKMVFQKEGNKLKYYPSPVDEGVVNWCIYLGIDRQEDRFGNALIYTWHQRDIDGDGVNDDFYLTEIANNRTDAKLQFENNLEPFHWIENGPTVCSAVKLVSQDISGGSSKIVRMNYDSYYSTYEVSIEDDYSPSYTYDYTPANNTLVLIRKSEPVALPPPVYDVATEYSFYQDNSLDTITFKERLLDGYVAYGSQKNFYEYDSLGNLTTTTAFLNGNDAVGWFWSSPSLHMKTVRVTTPFGAVNEERTILCKNVKDPNCTLDLDDAISDNIGKWPVWNQIQAEEQVKDVRYLYEDASFPLRPTSIIENFDENGDGVYDGNSHKIEMSYDDRGNLIEQRDYIDSNNFVFTEYDYHPCYNFPVRQTTWQGYCYEEAENIVTTGQAVESLYKYGDKDGNIPTGEPNISDKYLAQVWKLIDEGQNPEDDIWAKTQFTYNTKGSVVSRTDPCGGIDFYEYDANGFLSKEWNGAQLNSLGLPVGNPQKRYYYDRLGNVVLKADYLGKVEKNHYDYGYSNGAYSNSGELGNVNDVKIYKDLDAMSRSSESFNPAYYSGLTCVSQTVFRNYTHYGKPGAVTLPYGAHIWYGYFRDRVSDYTPEDEGGEWQLTWYQLPKVLPYSTHTGDLPSCSNMLSTIQFLHDSIGRVTRKYYVDGETPKQYDEYAYNAVGNKIYEKIFVVSKRYGSYGDDIGILQKYAAYEYDTLNRVIKQIIDPNSSRSPNDPCNPNNPNGLDIITRYGYDAIGNQIYAIDSNNNVTFVDYDNANRKVREYFNTAAIYYSGTDILDVNATKSNAKKKTETEYYLNDKVKSVTNYDLDHPNVLAHSEFSYDSRGRIDSVIEDRDDEETATTYYDYNDTGFMLANDSNQYQIRIEDAEDQDTYVSLDFHGKPQKILYPSGEYEQMTYDGPGSLLRKSVWSAGTEYQINYQYDKYGKLKRITYPQNGGYIEYGYTPRVFGNYGEVAKITDQRHIVDRPGNPAEVNSIYTFGYDYSSGNIISYTDCNDFEIQYDWTRGYNTKKLVKVLSPQNEVIYQTKYRYDMAGRLAEINDLTTDAEHSMIAKFGYDNRGNRTALEYSLDGTYNGSTVSVGYNYNNQNQMNYISTNGGPTYSFYAPVSIGIDGLGRLTYATENISFPGQANRSHLSQYAYDRQSSLTSSRIENINGALWMVYYNYKKDGNIHHKITNDQPASYEYDTDGNPATIFDSDIMTKADGNELDWDDNGRLAETPAYSFEYNWDGKLRDVNDSSGNRLISLKYDPMGNRVYKDSSVSGTRKYIVDISGGLPVILCELDDANGSIKNKYYYANAQILRQDNSSGSYFYIHDRLGSVRLLVNSSGSVVNSYTYSPYGEMFPSECNEQVYNPFKFTGQWFDSEIGQYYLRARQYDPVLMRLTGRDPVKGKYKYPLTFNPYLYCINNPINYVDPSGLMFGVLDRVASVIDAGNVRNVGYSTVLNSSFDLLTQTAILGMVNKQVAGYVNARNNIQRDRDYRSGPEAYRHLGITQKEIDDLGAETAEYQAELRIAMQGAYSSAGYAAGGFVAGAIGATCNIVGYDLIKAQNYIIGGIVMGVGGIIDMIGVYEAAQAYKIISNAHEASKNYCNPNNPIGP